MIEGQENKRWQIDRKLNGNINQLLVATKLFIERSSCWMIKTTCYQMQKPIN